MILIRRAKHQRIRPDPDPHPWYITTLYGYIYIYIYESIYIILNYQKSSSFTTSLSFLPHDHLLPPVHYPQDSLLPPHPSLGQGCQIRRL